MKSWVFLPGCEKSWRTPYVSKVMGKVKNGNKFVGCLEERGQVCI